jgi:hypothetical protein
MVQEIGPIYAGGMGFSLKICIVHVFNRSRSLLHVQSSHDHSSVTYMKKIMFQNFGRMGMAEWSIAPATNKKW